MAVEIKLELSWGRTFEEYIQMFNLNMRDLSKPIIGCGDGLSNFNKRLKEIGYKMVSCDPLYNKTKEEIKKFIINNHEYILPPNNRVEDSLWLYNTRKVSIDDFFEDYETGKQEGRYLSYSLPNLPFKDKEFDISLCSHFLFTYANLGPEFHFDSIKEMLRIANEVRIFPLIDTNCQRPIFFNSIIEKLEEENFKVDIIEVGYGFYRNGKEMLLVK